MRRVDAVRLILEAIGDRLLVVCNGMIGREVFTVKDRPQNFYMIGSMGLALPIGLGLAQTQPGKSVVVLDGDGNVLMGAGALANAGAAQPANLYHLVLDNEVHDSTGGQKTVSRHVHLQDMARAAGYRSSRRVAGDELEAALPALWREDGPAMLLVKVEPGSVAGIGRVAPSPPEIAQRFSRAAQA